MRCDRLVSVTRKDQFSGNFCCSVALAGLPQDRYASIAKETSDDAPKGPAMIRFALMLLLSATLALPALAQKKEEPKEAAKTAIPPNTFFKGQTASQQLAGEQLMGSKVTNKDGQTIGTIADLIVAGDRIEGVLLGVGGFLGVGEKKIGVRLGALKITRSGDKIAVSLPNATKEMLAAVPAYERAGAAPGKK
jgi:hypothetical protein